jgi:hypothetical protein
MYLAELLLNFACPAPYFANALLAAGFILNAKVLATIRILPLKSAKKIHAFKSPGYDKSAAI